MYNFKVPIECKCKIIQKESGYYEITLEDLPHPTIDGCEHSCTYGGWTIGDMFLNMGHNFPIYWNKVFPHPLINEKII